MDLSLIPMMSSLSLPPEYNNALRRVSYFFDVRNVERWEAFPSSEILQHDIIQITRSHVRSKDIPSGVNWKWNQVKARKFAHYPNAVVEFCKLLPRQREKGPSLSSQHKLWRFKVTPYNRDVYYILWSERGINSELDLNDLSFLAPLMDSQVAQQLWPSSIIPK